jgi:DNA recombination protein RmuC
MDELSLITGIIIGLIIGIIIGWVINRNRSSQSLPFQSVDLSSQTTILSNLNAQIAEMKGKFLEIERSRSQLDQQRAKYDEEREKRLREWMESTQKLFAEQVSKGKQIDEEKDKRIQDWMDQTKKFFEEQKGAYTSYLEQQGKSREEIEKKRDAQITDMSGMMKQFTRTISGTKTRGMVGEEQLREVLVNSIRTGVVVCCLKMDSGQVEFAWNLEDGKYIPIDCKLPDVFLLLEQYEKSENIEEQKDLKNEIVKKIEKEIKNIQKYQNQTNTIDSCILVVPEGILEFAPEIVGLGRDSNVFVCSYKDVFPVAYLIQEKYQHCKEQGDTGSYRQLISELFQILDKIEQKTNAIQTAITTISNANSAIKKQILVARQKPMGIEVETKDNDDDNTEK